MRWLYVVSSKNVEHVISSRDQIVRDDSAMTSPPNRLGAHDGASLGMAQFTQSGEPELKILGHRVISVIVETRILPKGIQRGWHVWASGSQTSERCDVLVIDRKLRQ